MTGIAHSTYKLLVTTINQIRQDNFTYNPITFEIVQKFKNESQQFPWKELEDQVGELADISTGANYTDGEAQFNRSEFNLFTQFVQTRTDTELLTQDVQQWEWCVEG